MAKSTPLAFERIRIHRLPGIDGGLTLDGFSAGINIIHGPNSSGKTSSARALRMLLWPRLAEEARAALAGSFTTDGVRWTVEVDIDRHEWQREGQPAAAPALPAVDQHERYSLSLHELLRADDVSFAKLILSEIAGGYDLDEAAQVLNPRIRASQLSKETKALAQARETRDEAVAKQQQLLADESELGTLRDERIAAERAKRQIEAIDCALELADARARVDEALRALQVYPPQMQKLHGNEAEQLTKIAEQAEKTQQALRDARSEVTEATERLGATRLSEPVETQLVLRLRQDLAELREADQAISELKKRRASAQTRINKDKALVGPDTDVSKIARIGGAEINRVSAFAKRAYAYEVEASRLTKARNALSEGVRPVDVRKLKQGLDLIDRWLRVPETAKKNSGSSRSERLDFWILMFVAAALLVSAAVAFTNGSPWLGSVLVVVLAGLSRVLWTKAQSRDRGPGIDERAIHQREFERLGLDGPESWEPQSVESFRNGLFDDVTDALEVDRRAQKLDEVKKKLEASEIERRAVELERKRLVEELGIPSVFEVAELVSLVERISSLQEAVIEFDQADEALKRAEGEADERRAKLVLDLSVYQSTELKTTSQIGAAIEDLAVRGQQFSDAHRDLSNAETRIESLEEHRDQLERDRQEILARLEIETAEESRVAEWCAQLAEYREADKAHMKAEAECASVEMRLRGFSDGADLEILGRDELLTRRAELDAQAARLEELSSRITQIETLVDEAKKSHGVEAAVAKVERCEDELRDALDRDIDAVLANLFIEHVRAAVRDQQLPPVFHRARGIFAQITHSAHRLEFETGDSPAFRAVDVQTGKGYELDELSSGTRVQLLLAVRLAFVESQEDQLKLPIVLDEALGNSDDARAYAMMSAAIDLARSGRQIFYLTAQDDEVGKWKAMLARNENSDVPSRFIDIGKVRKLEKRVDTGRLEIFRQPTLPLPEPGEMSHADYGKVLGIPKLDPSRSVDAVHLWYLTRDPEELYTCLEQHLETWGKLRTAHEISRGAAIIAPESYDRIAASARVFESIIREFRVGRGRKVDRQVLVESGAITPVFIDQVDDLCREVSGDAKQLVEALDGLKGFYRSKREQLRDYLEQEGYLDPNDTLSAEEILPRVLGTVSDDVKAGRVTAEFIDRAIRLIVEGDDDAGPGADPEQTSEDPLLQEDQKIPRPNA